MKTSKKIFNSVTKTINNTNSPSSLEMKLKAADSEIQEYIVALTKENLTLQKKVSKCEAQKITLNSRITILENELNEEKQKFKLVDYIKQMKKERSE